MFTVAMAPKVMKINKTETKIEIRSKILNNQGLEWRKLVIRYKVKRI